MRGKNGDPFRALNKVDPITKPLRSSREMLSVEELSLLPIMTRLSGQLALCYPERSEKSLNRIIYLNLFVLPANSHTGRDRPLWRDHQ